jgi:hypothetical protein
VDEKEDGRGKFVQTEIPVGKTGKGQQRQSEKLKQQGLTHVKAAEKAEALTMDKNLEGNNISSKNSFALLSNNELMIRPHLMGVEVYNSHLETFDVLKDLEKARSNLLGKKDNNNLVDDKNKESSSPLLLMLLIKKLIGKYLVRIWVGVPFNAVSLSVSFFTHRGLDPN